MDDMTVEPVLLTPKDYHVIGPEDFGAPGLVARESIGPAVAVQTLGPLVMVHDSTFEPRSGIGHHPHRRMERLFYILEGAVDHDDALNEITGHMATGDLGILTEGERGMVHSEVNNTDGPARCYIFVYPTDPTPPTAGFDAVRDADAPRTHPAPGITSKHVITRERRPLHGDIRIITDSSLEDRATLSLSLDAFEAGLIFAVEGVVEVTAGAGRSITVTRDSTLLLPPRPGRLDTTVTARAPSRIIHTVTGPGFGFRVRTR